MEQAEAERPASTGTVSLALQQALRSWEGMTGVMPIGVYVCDAGGRLVRYNARAAELWGRAPPLDEAGPLHCGAYKAYEFDGSPLLEPPVAAALITGQPVREREILLERPDGSRIYLLVNVEPLRDHGGTVVGAIACFQDTTRVKAAENALRERDRRLASIIESTDDAIVSKDLNGVVQSWNKGAEQLFGYSAKEMIGQSITLLIPPDSHDEESAILERIRRGERIDHYETVRRRKDGQLIDISLTVSPVLGPQGDVIGASKIARDITARKELEERQRALLEEINHRVKNTLATVQSLATHTFRAHGDAQEMRDVFIARLFALSRTHDQLTIGGWQSADLKQVAAGVFAPYSDAARVRLDGPSLRLGAQSALTVAMVLHELMTNAEKYGSLSVPAGTLALSWRAIGNAELAIDWREAGGPDVEAPAERGFGLRLMERGIVDQLRGTAKIEFDRAGLRCQMTIPLPSDVKA